MNTYLVHVEAPSGEEIIQQATAAFDEAANHMGKRTRNISVVSSYHAIPSSPVFQSSELSPELLSATGSLIACLVLLVIADYKLRAWLCR